MQPSVTQIKNIIGDIEDFLDFYEIKHNVHSLNVERDWIDCYITISDPAQMKRINTWLSIDLVAAIKGWSNIQIDAPVPIAGKEDQLRVRVCG